MSYRSMQFARATHPGHWRALSATLLLSMVLAGCAGGPSPREAEPQRIVEVPEVPVVEIPESAFTDFAAALNYLQRGQMDAAESSLRRMIQQYPQVAGPYTNLAGLLAQRGDNEEALEFARQAVQRNPRSAAAYNLQGLLARRTGEFQEAEQAYQNALMADPAFGDANRNLGILYDLYLRQPRQALTAYKAYQAGLEEPDATVAIWIADLERRTR